MVTIEQIARAALNWDSLEARALTQEFLRTVPIPGVPLPATDDPRLLAACASLVELFAQRAHQPPPPWTQRIPALPEPFYLLKSALTMKRLRAMCEAETPEPLRKRGFYSSADYLVLV
jgi:hypothetical protein